MAKEWLILDFDGVVGYSIDCIVSLYNEDFKYHKFYKPVNACEINTYEFKECELATYEQILHYFDTPRSFERLEFMYHADEVMRKLVHYYNISIATIGTYPNLKQKERWVREKAPYIEEFIGIDIEKYKDKSHIDMSGATYVDDMAKNLELSNADRKILFGDIYPWNETWKGTRCYNWIDIKNELTKEHRRW